MNYPWLDEYCLSKQGATKDWKEEWQAARYMVGGKMFAMQGDDNTDRPIITLKLIPADGDFLRRQYEDIIPGYYMNKEHWNSVYLDGAVPDEIVRDMIDKSHAILFASLTKKAQKEITG
jgi:predicted DNA-binding protein (MmcQ/YjbR family)